MNESVKSTTEAGLACRLRGSLDRKTCLCFNLVVREFEIENNCSTI
jgi:hypothetical protein